MPRFFETLYVAADKLNRENIHELLGPGVLCDLGCDDGAWTTELAQLTFGLEINRDRAKIARSNGIRVVVADLNLQFPFADSSFDVVHSNQVIEHVKDVDHFISETIRILRPGGIAVISTENGSSWHNIFAAVMGWQTFSLSSVSIRARSIGNPLAIHRGEAPRALDKHRTIFNYRGLIEIMQIHGLTVERVLGAGYYPLPAGVGRLDPRHGHFLTLRALKSPT